MRPIILVAGQMAAEPADRVLAGTSSHSVVSVSHPVRPPPAACLKLLLRSALRQRAQAVPIDKAAGFLYSKRSKAVADPELDAPPSPIRARPPPNAPVMPATDGLPGRPRPRRHERPTRRVRVPLLGLDQYWTGDGPDIELLLLGRAGRREILAALLKAWSTSSYSF